ncbi:hypothetical protein G694_04738 [Escherichia coli HVH 18 (4-8589585)]|nr:hypothetical protein G694_04738 [Escherichia coli HVH 18 (4-8589585)]
MNREIQQRLQWVKLYETSGDAGFVCRRCGISRPTLRKMVAQISGSGHRWSGKPQPSPQAFTINENRHLRSRSDSGVTFSAKSGGKTYSKRVKTTSFNLTGNSNNPQSPFPESGLNRPGFPGECFICELRLPDHRFRWKHNKLFLLLPEEYGPAFPAIVDCYTSPPTLVWPVPLLHGFSSSYGVLPPLCKDH